MLVVVHHGDVEFAAQPLFDDETLRGFDILQVDAAEGGRDVLDRPDEFVRVVRIHLDVENVYVGECFEKQSFSFHDGFAGQRSDVAQTEYCRSVGDDGHQIGLRGIFVCVLGVLLYFEARIGYAGGVGQRQVALRPERFDGDDFEFAGPALGMVFQGSLFQFCMLFLHGRFLSPVFRSVRKPAQIYQLFSGFSYSVPYSPFRAVPSACPYGFPVRRYGRCGMLRTSCTPPVRGAGAFSGHFSRFSAGERGVASIASDGDGVRKFRSIYGKHSIVIMNCE